MSDLEDLGAAPATGESSAGGQAQPEGVADFSWCSPEGLQARRVQGVAAGARPHKEGEDRGQMGRWCPIPLPSTVPPTGPTCSEIKPAGG